MVLIASHMIKSMERDHLTDKNGKNEKNYIRSLFNSTDRLSKTNNLHQSRVMMRGLMKIRLGTMT